MATFTYVVTTHQYGDIYKLADNISEAREWARKAFARGEVICVQRERPRRCDDCLDRRNLCSACRRRAKGGDR